ncbi:MAG: 4Fe-4S dicluster domain-containing protein [Candidatus Bathyarchaeia archaeon]
MKLKVIPKDRIPGLIDGLIERYRVFAPVGNARTLRFREISSGEEACLDFYNTKLSSKEILFPQNEVLFIYKKDSETIDTEATPSTKLEWVIFGVRPCDARGIALTDVFFSSGEHKDQPYLEKRDRTAIVGLACNHPLSTCFCTSTGGSPFGKEGMDLLLVDLGDRYSVEVLTERGEKLLGVTQGLKYASKEDAEMSKRLSEDAERAFRKRLPTEGLVEKLDGMFDDPIWDGVHQKCVGCGICTFVCPTCWCFDVVDEETATSASRIRLWDTCQFPVFTLQGSGFNPRPTGKERMRQRVMHKLNYFMKEFGAFACVGCGRCVRECPVNLDIREIMRAIMSE